MTQKIQVPQKNLEMSGHVGVDQTPIQWGDQLWRFGYLKKIAHDCQCFVNYTDSIWLNGSKNWSSWWLNQPIWKILVKLDHFSK